MARTKRVFDTDEIAHLWMHQTQSEARNKQDNFYFRDSMIFSYGSHFLIAKYIQNKKGERAVVMTTDTHSNTTGGHISLVNRAVFGKVFRAPISDHVKYDRVNFEYLFKSYKERIDKEIDGASKPRIRPATILKHKDNIDALVKEANELAEFYGRKQRLTAPASMDAVIEARKKDMERAERKAIKEQAKIEKERAERERQRIAELEQYRIDHTDELLKWRETGQEYFTTPEGVHYYLRLRNWPTALLRVEGDEVITSLGVHVPLDHAEKAFRFINAIRGKRSYSANETTQIIRIGHYQIHSIDLEGNILAGCHNIAWSEIEYLAQHQGWISAPETSTVSAELTTH